MKSLKLIVLASSPSLILGDYAADLASAKAASTGVDTIIGESTIADMKTAYQLETDGVSFQDFAQTQYPGCTFWEQAKTYHGSVTYIDDYLMTAFDATGQFAGTLEPTERGDMVDAKLEAIKKGLQDQAQVTAAICKVGTATNGVWSYMTENNWFLAEAYWKGTTESATPWARANKRCKNYGTCVVVEDTGDGGCDGSATIGDGSCVAQLNVDIEGYIAAGKVAATQGLADDAKAAYDKFRGAALGVYYQASLRYAFKIDSAVTGASATSDVQGEGGAFWRVIEPVIAALDPTLSTYVTTFYDMNTNPVGGQRYCPLLHLLTNHMVDEFTAAMFGTLEGTGSVVCMAGIQLPGNVDASITTAATASTKVSEVIGTAGVGTSMAAAKALYVGSILETVAKGLSAKTSTYIDDAEAYFGSATWIDDYLLTALDATGQFAGTLAPESRGDMMDARTEAVKKGLQDQIMAGAAIAALQDITLSANTWLTFWAYWAGDTPGGAPWARANKRCKNYGTCGGMTAGADGELATINSQLLVEVINGVAVGSETTVAKAVSLAKLVYYQASLRYGFKIDTAVAGDSATSDVQGEGGAFWRVIAGSLAAIDAKSSDAITAFYTMTTAPSGTNKYCMLKTFLAANLPAGTTATDMGTLEGTGDVVCTTPPSADDDGATTTTLVITAPGSVTDYDADEVAGAAAASLNVYPSQVTATIAAATAARRRLDTAGVTITLTVVTTAADAAAMATSMTTLAGSAAAASTFLSAATGTTVTVTAEPVVGDSATTTTTGGDDATTTTTGDDDAAAEEEDPCFDSSATVTKADGSVTRMSSLKDGDVIVAANADGSLTTDSISMSISVSKPEARSTFITLKTGGGIALNLTAGHHVPVGQACCSNLKKAEDVLVGEKVWAVGSQGAAVPHVVTKLTKTESTGLHSPVCLHGKFPVVNGLVTSFDSINFVTLASYGLPALVQACTATNTCGLLRYAMGK